MTDFSKSDNPQWIEQQAMDATEGDKHALQLLKETAAKLEGPFAEYKDEIREGWVNSFSLLDEELPTNELGELLFQLARTGFDTQQFRDALARLFRYQFSDYADPAGLIQALGVHSNKTPVSRIYARWERMLHLQEDGLLYHPAHGLGRVREIDDLSNEVRVMFDRPKTFDLKTVLDKCVLARPGSLVADIRSRGTERPLAEIASDIRDEMPECFMPPTEKLDILRAFLVPECCSQEEFNDLFRGRPTRKKKGPAKTVPPKNTSPAGSLGAARSLDELLVGLRSLESLKEVDQESRETIADLLSQAAGKKNSVDKFAEAVGLLWGLTDGAPWLVQLVQNLASEVIPWRNAERMAETTNRMKAGLANDWLRAAAEALSADDYARICVNLPMRSLAVAEACHKAVHGHVRTWDERMRRQIKTNSATADQLMNLWRRDGREADELCDPALVLRTVGRPVRGPYLQAQKALYKLLLQSEKFQDFLTGDGDAKVAPGFIAAVKHSASLQSGERQSLLVKLVRRHPHLKPYVEQRSAPRKKKMVPVTSEQSYQARQNELHSIIREKIPANSKAIAHARSYGDLKENAEYKAAKEEQAYLTSRRNELEDSLDKVRPVNFRDVEDPDKVVPGVQVKLEDDRGEAQLFYVLGLWDSEPDRHIISYETPLGRKMMGKSPGEDIIMPSGVKMRIAAVEKLPEEILEWQDGDE